MISVYLREMKRYSYDELKKIFKCTNDELDKTIGKLKEYYILKVVPFTKEQKELSELIEDDISVNVFEYSDSKYYIFDFVGIVIIYGIVLKIYPKYIRSDELLVEKMKQVLNVIDKFNNREQIIKIFNESDYTKAYNNLAVCLYFLNDYFENGLYTKEFNVIEENGNGEIFWEKTVNEAFTFISEDRPYYMSLYTKRRINDDYNYFKVLHETIVSLCSKELENSDILDLFDLTGVDFEEHELEEFGDTEYILYRLENEMNVQFNTRKNNVLKMMYAYVANKGSLEDVEHLSMFGTNSFNLVWEKVCAKILDNHLDTYLCDLDIGNNVYSKKDGKLIDVIEKPQWIGLDANEKFIHESATLKPDIISIKNNLMHIFDAKYYYLSFDKKLLSGQPGIESITKQYLYQLAYKKFANKHNISQITNSFVFPIDNDDIIHKGLVKMEMLSLLGLENISIYLLPAKKVFSSFLNGEKITIY